MLVSPILYLQWKVILSLSVRSFKRGNLTVLDHDVEEERLVQMPDEQHPGESDSVLSVEGVDFPE